MKNTTIALSATTLLLLLLLLSNVITGVLLWRSTFDAKHWQTKATELDSSLKQSKNVATRYQQLARDIAIDTTLFSKVVSKKIELRDKPALLRTLGSVAQEIFEGETQESKSVYLQIKSDLYWDALTEIAKEKKTQASKAKGDEL